MKCSLIYSEIKSVIGATKLLAATLAIHTCGMASETPQQTCLSAGFVEKFITHQTKLNRNLNNDMARAFSPMEILRKQHKTINWSPEWEAAFGKPEMCGVWFVWGNSANGKTTFTMQLLKELSHFGRVFFNAREEGTGLTMKQQIKMADLSPAEVKSVLIGNEDLDQLHHRLNARKSPKFIITDSFQYMGMNFSQYKQLKEAHPDKLFIYISHAEGKQPAGRTAKAVRYDADLKIWVEGFKAISNGRYNPGGEFIIWAEGAEKYYGTKIQTA